MEENNLYQSQNNNTSNIPVPPPPQPISPQPLNENVSGDINNVPQEINPETSNNINQVPTNNDLPNNNISVEIPKKKINKLFLVGIIFIILALIGGYFYYVNNFQDNLLKKDDVVVDNKDNSDQDQVVIEKDNTQININVEKNNREINQETLTVFTKEELQGLGIIQLPDGFSVQEEYKGVKLVRSPQNGYSEMQLAFLKKFIDNTPKKLLDPGPAAIVTFKKDELDMGYGLGRGLAVAFASGNYLFFDDESFDQGFFNDNSLDRVYYTFEHELMHVAQFNAGIDMMISGINKYIEEKISWLEVCNETDLFADFAKISNWKKIVNDYGESDYELEDKKNTKTTEYGTSGIHEDMAESVAGVISGQDYDFSQERKQWVLNYLGETYENLIIGKFPFAENLLLAKTFFLESDEYKIEDAYKTKYLFSERQIFINEDENSIEKIKEFYSDEFNSRGFKGGEFKKTINENGVIIYENEYNYDYKNLYLRLKSYDNATGYSEKPVGTQVLVINGYKI